MFFFVYLKFDFLSKEFIEESLSFSPRVSLSLRGTLFILCIFHRYQIVRGSNCTWKRKNKKRRSTKKSWKYHKKNNNTFFSNNSKSELQFIIHFPPFTKVRGIFFFFFLLFFFFFIVFTLLSFLQTCSKQSPLFLP